MPYTDREKQLTYMRIYMQRKRALDRIGRLKQRKQRLIKQYEEDPILRYFISKEELGSRIPEQIEECLKTVKQCDGLLKSGLNSSILGGGG